GGEQAVLAFGGQFVFRARDEQVRQFMAEREIVLVDRGEGDGGFPSAVDGFAPVVVVADQVNVFAGFESELAAGGGEGEENRIRGGENGIDPVGSGDMIEEEA